MKKTISLLLIIITLSTLFASCGDAAVKLPEPENGKTVFTLGGEEIKYDYVRYVYLNTKADMEYGEGENYWENNPEAFEELKASTLDTIARNRAIELLGKRYKIELTASEKQAVNDTLEELKADKSGWEEAKKENYLTDYSFAYIQRFSVLWGKTYDYVISPESGVIKSDDVTVLEDIPENFRNIRYVYIKYSESNKEAKKALADEVLEKANAGEDFAQLIKEHGEDTTMANYIDIGYYYTIGMIDEKVENAVEELEYGEISPIIDVKTGFFIVKRETIDLEYANKNIATFADYYVARRFNEMVAEIQKDMKMEFSDFWKNLKLDDIK
ncbi:MAG: peptidylprolyl isomerase [Clostridia bacterium]|nr:peptidylprolyl isomerase [Clostridia bacterium]